MLSGLSWGKGEGWEDEHDRKRGPCMGWLGKMKGTCRDQGKSAFMRGKWRGRIRNGEKTLLISRGQMKWGHVGHDRDFRLHPEANGGLRNG